MKRLKDLAVAAFILLPASIFTGCTALTYTTPTPVSPINYENPAWAPPYYDGARYYYLPDVECYYDLSTREFIYLNHGQWFYSPNFPSFYADFDLNNCFTVILNTNVYRPWMHHQYYVSHYPRYYYRDYYDHSNIPYVRGFNENDRRAVYWRDNERNRARNWDNSNMENNRRFKYSKDDRDQQKRSNNQEFDRRPNNDRNNNDNRDNTRNQGDRNDRNRDMNTNTDQSNKDRNRDTRTNTDNNNNNNNNNNNRSTSQQTTTNTRSEKTNDTNYYGKTIGNPVKVEKQMQDRPVVKSTGRR